jgi:hypothetical protein
LCIYENAISSVLMRAEAEAEAAEEDPRNEAYRAPRFHHSALPSLVFLGFLIYAVARSHREIALFF